MSKTLLEITQEILTVMTSDEVNSINDTAEAEAVATIVKGTFESLISSRDWKHTRELIQLESLADSDRPTHMRVPNNVKRLDVVNYDKARASDTRVKYQSVKWKEPDEFLYYTNNRVSTSSTVTTVTDASGVKILVLNNAPPTYYTSFDDEHIVFDSYDSEVDSILKVSKFQVMGYVIPETSFTDDWTPDLPDEALRLLIEESKSKAQSQINSFNDVKAEQDSGRQNRWLSRNSWKTNGGINYPNYGRK